jgi:hypothetical protein
MKISHKPNFALTTLRKEAFTEQLTGNLKAFEIKWSSRKQPKPPKALEQAYPDAEFQVIHPTNYLAYVL